ncbi:AAA family ATPase [Halobium salinum]|uniref:AAA family ATPase n=1 Tax=Halobium salinum TaxID=1364940 RepID=A0ABD5PGI4_9EURY|nr:AAA family ATPase [Halobium salinum]
MSDDSGLELSVRGAEKRDAGRGIARLPQSAMQALSVISGDTVVVAGERETVAKVWPGRGLAEEGTVLVDADTRGNAGVHIGDTVRVRKEDVEEADAVTLAAPDDLSNTSRDVVVEAVRRELLNRPLHAEERVRIERLGGSAFVVERTSPDGIVSVTDETRVEVAFADDTVRSGSGPGAGSRTTGTGSAPSSTSSSSSASNVDGASGAGSSGGGRASGAGAGAGSTSESGRAANHQRTGVSYEDIGGLDEELELVREMIELPLSEPELFTRLGVEPPKGVLLHGPPGTGKTLIAKAVANEVDAHFISVSGPEIVSKYKGDSEERLRETFAEARNEAPTVVFFDEIDSIGGKRDEGGDMEDRIVGQLLSLMDGLEGRGEVVVIGATNRVDDLDPALRRGGRFDREIEIGVPGEAGRREILDVHTRNMPLADDVDLDRVADRTYGFVGADLESLAKEAAMTALRRLRRGSGPEKPRSVGVGDGDRGEDEDEGDGADGESADAHGEGDDDTRSATGIAIDDLQVTRSDFDAAMASVEPSAMREYVAEQPSTTYADVGGLDEAKATLQRSVTWPLTYGPLFDAANADPPTGVLLHGPPGTGKTLLAKAIAGETGVNFIHVAGPELLDRYVGESEKAVRKVFERARQAAPAIVFFDEIDAIATTRDGGGSDSGVGERVVSQLLTELDRLSENPNLVVLAATNRKPALDPALLRPGRLESHVEVPAPDEAGRRKIFAVHTADKPLADDVDLDDLASRTANYTGADVQAVCREAAMLAIKDVTERYEGETANEHADEVVLRDEHFEAALDTVSPTLA